MMKDEYKALMYISIAMVITWVIIILYVELIYLPSIR